MVSSPPITFLPVDRIIICCLLRRVLAVFVVAVAFVTVVEGVQRPTTRNPVSSYNNNAVPSYSTTAAWSSSSSRQQHQLLYQQQQQQQQQQQEASVSLAARLNTLRGGDDERGDSETSATDSTTAQQQKYGRISEDEYVLTPEQIETFYKDGCVTLDNVLTEDEVTELEQVFDMFLNGEIYVPDKDYCDMSKPFGIPSDQWSIVNCMLPTKYYPPLRGNVYERLTSNIARQLFPNANMVKDYDQLLNKRPGKIDAVFAWHQDMAYWPGSKALGLSATNTETCTFSLAVDDSDEMNGCLRYVVGSGVSKTLRPHRPAMGDNRDDGHALAVDVGSDPNDVIRNAPAKRGSVTVHDEYVVHGSSGNQCLDRMRRTYVLAYRDKAIVDAERAIGFTHSHNDEVNWDTFQDDELHRVKKKKSDDEEKNKEEEEGKEEE